MRLVQALEAQLGSACGAVMAGCAQALRRVSLGRRACSDLLGRVARHMQCAF